MCWAQMGHVLIRDNARRLCRKALSWAASPERCCFVQVDYLRNYEYLMDTTFKRAHPVKYTPGTTGDPTRIPPLHMYFIPTQ